MIELKSFPQFRTWLEHRCCSAISSISLESGKIFRNWITTHKYSLFSFVFRTGGLLTRRLRGRKYDDNELYRSNSFRFQRFERNANDPRGDSQVSSAYSISCPSAHISLTVNKKMMNELRSTMRVTRAIYFCLLSFFSTNRLLHSSHSGNIFSRYRKIQ